MDRAGRRSGDARRCREMLPVACALIAVFGRETRGGDLRPFDGGSIFSVEWSGRSPNPPVLLPSQEHDA